MKPENAFCLNQSIPNRSASTFPTALARGITWVRQPSSVVAGASKKAVKIKGPVLAEDKTIAHNAN